MSPASPEMTTINPHAEPVPRNPRHIIARLWSHRGLIKQLTAREVGARYRGSYGGLLWSFLTPLLMLTVYTVLFSYVFKSKWRPDADGTAPLGEFALTLFAGLIPFNLFSEVVQRSPTLVLAVPSYVKRVVFPLEILTLIALGGALVTAGLSMIVLVSGLVLFLHTLHWTMVLIPIVLLPLLLLAMGMSWFLASLGTYVRDVGQFVGVAIQAVLFMTPIFWPAHAAPKFLQPLLWINPLAPVVEGFRKVTLYGEMPDFLALGIWTCLTAVIAWTGYMFFVYTKRGFADVM